MKKPQEELRTMVRQLFRDDQGRPILLTDGQVELFEIIVKKQYPRTHCMTYTRYGKSLTVALAVLARAATFPEKWAIVAGTKEKAKIIMGYINAHIFDSEYTASKFRFESGDSAESIRRNRNKNHISFDHGQGKLSEIFICSAAEAIGFGAPNIIADEASLIEDDDWALVMRMLGDDAQNSFMFEIGNPFYRNHFLKESLDPNYKKICIDYVQGIEEGRLTEEYVTEMRKYSFFKVLYEVKFPSASEVDDKGWSYLLSEDDIKRAQARWATLEKTGAKRLGNDIARGGRNFNVWCLRGENYATFLAKDHEDNLMNVAGKTIDHMKTQHVDDGHAFLDDTGVGGGVTDKMKEEGYHPVAIQLGAKATELKLGYNPVSKKEELMPAYANMRAQLYAGGKGVQYWVKHVGALDPTQDWSELTRIRYKKNGSGLTMIESKEDMRARGEESPDDADAFMLTFGDVDTKPGTRPFEMVDPAMIIKGGVKPY